jgi:hypothetical protein
VQVRAVVQQSRTEKADTRTSTLLPTVRKYSRRLTPLPGSTTDNDSNRLHLIALHVQAYGISRHHVTLSLTVLKLVANRLRPLLRKYGTAPPSRAPPTSNTSSSTLQDQKVTQCEFSAFHQMNATQTLGPMWFPHHQKATARQRSRYCF